MDQQEKILAAEKKYKVTQDVDTKEMRIDTNNIKCFYDIIKAYAYVTPQDKSITHETLSSNFEAKHGNIETIRRFIRNGQVISPILNIILSNLPFIEMNVDISTYIQEMEEKLSEGRIIKYKTSNSVTYEDSIKRRAEVEYLYSAYFNEHKDELNKIFLLTNLSNYFSSDSLKEIISQMTDEDWAIFEETTRLYFQNKNPEKAAENVLMAKLYTELINTDGAEIATTIDRYPIPNLFNFIAEKAVLHDKFPVVSSIIDKYIAARAYENLNLKALMEENALEAMIRGNLEICKKFLSKEMWETYDIDTKTCIYSLIQTRSGTQTIVELFDYMRVQGIEINEEKLSAINETNILNFTLKKESNPPAIKDVAHSRYMAGNIYITPEDRTITIDELRAKSLLGRNQEQDLEEIKREIGERPEFYFTKSIINNEMIVTSHISAKENYELRYKALENFNSCFIENMTLKRNINHSLLLDQIYSDYFNSTGLSIAIDPALKLLAFGIPEILSKDTLNSVKEDARADIEYFKFAANRMHQNVSSRMGDIIADTIFASGNKALKMLKQNENFNSEDIIALRFAILHGKEEITTYCIKKYIKTVEKKLIPHQNINKLMGEYTLTAIIRGNKETCLSFIENMWKITDNSYKAQLLNLIITRSGKETREHLIDYLVTRNLLDYNLKEELYKSSSIPQEIREIKEFIAPIFDKIKQKQNLIASYETSIRLPEQILEDKPKLKQLHNSFAELIISCIRNFGDDKNKWEEFTKNKLSKLEKFSSITAESFNANFSMQTFTEKANEFIASIQENLLSRSETISLTAAKKNKKSSIQKITSKAAGASINSEEHNSVDAIKALSSRHKPAEEIFISGSIITKEEEAEFIDPRERKKKQTTPNIIMAEENDQKPLIKESRNKVNKTLKQSIKVGDNKKTNKAGLQADNQNMSSAMPTTHNPRISAAFTFGNFDESINISDKKPKNAETKIDDNKLKTAVSTSEIIDGELTAITFGSFKNEAKEMKPTSISFVQREEERRARNSQQEVDRIKAESSSSVASSIKERILDRSPSPKSNYQQGGVLYTERGSLMPCIIHNNKTYITKSVQGNNYLLQEVIYRIEKVSSNEEKKIITDFVGQASLHDISKSSYTQAYQTNKAITKSQQEKF